MKNVIIFAPTLEDDSNLSIWMNELGKAFSTLGYNVLSVDLDKSECLNNVYQIFNGNCQFALGMQNMGIDLVTEEGKSIYDACNVPYINILSDTPYNFNSNKLYEYKIVNQLILCLDKSYLQYLNLWNDFFPNVDFFCLGGTSSFNDNDMEVIDDISEKEINVLFVGLNYSFQDRPWHGLVTPEVAAILDDVLDAVLSRDFMSIIEGFEFVCDVRQLELNTEIKKKLYSWSHLIYLHIRTYRRQKLVETVARSGLRMDVIGRGWDKEYYSKWLNLHGQMSYRKTLELIAKSKILLNENGNFCTGAHERFFTGMLNRALVITDKSLYCNEKFVEGDDFASFSWQKLELLPHLLVEMLLNDQNRKRISNFAYHKAARDHTWLARAKEIANIVGNYFPDRKRIDF